MGSFTVLIIFRQILIGMSIWIFLLKALKNSSCPVSQVVNSFFKISCIANIYAKVSVVLQSSKTMLSNFKQIDVGLGAGSFFENHYFSLFGVLTARTHD